MQQQYPQTTPEIHLLPNTMNGRFWFAMRFLYNHRSDTQKRLESNDIETFTPMRYEIRNIRGRKVRAYVPVIPSLLFVHSTKNDLEPFLKSNNYFQFQYSRGGRRATPIIVPDDQMKRFICAVQESERPIYLSPDELNVAKGTKVKILGGPFDGVIGTFMKVKGARAKRLIIEIPDTVVVAVEISPDLVEIIDD